MTEQERALHFSAAVDRLLDPAERPMGEETLALAEDQELLDLAQTLARLDFSPQSRFLRQLRRPQGGKMNVNHSQSIRRRPARLVLAFAMTILVLAALLAFPPTRALAQEMWQSLFTRQSADTIPAMEMQAGPIATALPIAPGQEANRLAEISALAGFQVKEATYLPAGYSLHTVHYEEGLGSVIMFFTDGGPAGLTLSFQQGPTATLGTGLVAETAVVETVQIGDNHGEYVHGEWVFDKIEFDEAQGTMSMGTGTWNPDGPGQNLRWVDGEMSYILSTPPGQETDLQLADLIRIAESAR
jgi:hypothetical protein